MSGSMGAKLLAILDGSAQTQSSAQKIEELVQSCDVVVFALSACGLCMEAEQMLRIKGARYKMVYVEYRLDARAIRRVLSAHYHTPTVPVIFIHGSCIGGLQQLQELETHRQLDALLFPTTH
ncbi:Glutaredoxin-C1 [Porphyridium purpureum]|uniref:Glutaredoxin-C1 n=1 Tax=Porphyridium purpureum TaxID=35688 RepID=A0A5J4Z6T2_PORPP|nr:Glutaredoxin-C1 [Porphyridium purpureum]|eukprot:POR0586..scf295_1